MADYTHDKKPLLDSEITFDTAIGTFDEEERTFDDFGIYSTWTNDSKPT